MASAPSDIPSKNDPYASLRSREFQFYLVIRFAIVFALNMQFAVVEWRVYELSHDPFSLGLMGLAEVIPSVGLALFAGHIVDKMEKRGMLLKCIIGYLFISIALFALTWKPVTQHITDHTALIGIYILVFIGGIVRAFVSPSTFTLMALLVPREQYANAATWSSSAWQIGAIMGPALGGFFIHWFGVHGAMFAVVLVFLLPLFSTLQIKPKPVYYHPKDGDVFKSLGEGMRFVWNTKVVLGAMALDMFAVLFGGAVSMLPAFAKDILHVGSDGYGMLRAAPAIGSTITMFILAYFPLKKKPGIKLLAAVFVFGLCMIVFGLSTSFYLSIFALFLSGVVDGVSVITRQTILQLKTPDEMRGRVAAVSSMFVGSSNELGAFESGFAARALGLVASVVAGGCVTLGVVVTTYIISPAMRKLDLKA